MGEGKWVPFRSGRVFIGCVVWCRVGRGEKCGTFFVVRLLKAHGEEVLYVA